MTADESIGEGGGWGIGDALGDARDILRVTAGVALIGAAILLPLALLALLLLAAPRLIARLRRERALDRL